MVDGKPMLYTCIFFFFFKLSPKLIRIRHFATWAQPDNDYFFFLLISGLYELIPSVSKL